MRVWGFVSQKGGAGKTTLCAHLSAYAVQRGERVLVIDLDPQESARAWHLKRGTHTETPAVLAVVEDNVTKVVAAAETLGITLVMIDTAPATNAGALATVRASGLIITPTQPNFFDMAALKSTVGLISRLNKLEQAVCVVNVLHSQSSEADFRDAEMMAQAMGISVAPTYCTHRRAYARSLQEGKGVSEYKPKDHKAIAEIEGLWEHLNGLNPSR